MLLCTFQMLQAQLMAAPMQDCRASKGGGCTARAPKPQLLNENFTLLLMLQVVDARDPLLYRSEDLEKYCRELHPSKASLLLLNKADLLPIPLRLAWADYFHSIGLDCVFWSAKVATEGRSSGLLCSETGNSYDAVPDGVTHQQQHAPCFQACVVMASRKGCPSTSRFHVLSSFLSFHA